jgi:hypothetical protein
MGQILSLNAKHSMRNRSEVEAGQVKLPHKANDVLCLLPPLM